MPRTVDQSDVVIEARRWIGTPFRHRGHHLGRACDCVGIVRGVSEALGLVAIPEETARELSLYSRTPNPNRMGELIATFLTRAEIDPKSAAPDGHVAWLQWTADLPMHLAITATYRERPTLIHALREHGVSEHGFVGAWRRRVHSYWRFPNVSYSDDR
jgi:NlpC/P60 family putative phage cell wall peptidase